MYGDGSVHNRDACKFVPCVPGLKRMVSGNIICFYFGRVGRGDYTWWCLGATPSLVLGVLP